MPTRPKNPLRLPTFLLHILIATIATLSLATNHFNLWIDLRLLPAPLALSLTTLWTLTTLLIPFLAGPRLASLKNPHWINRPLNPKLAQLLLLPTYLLIAILLINTTYYYQLFLQDRIDSNLPITLPAALLLSLWTLGTHRWLHFTANHSAFRISHSALPRSPASFKTLAATLLLTATSILFTSALLLLHSFSHPPTQPVDLAVVLGNRVLPDGSASTSLKDRTLAAIHLYQQGLTHHLLLSGAIHPSDTPGDPALDEPNAMLQVCLDNHIPREDISLDPLGITTRATAVNTLAFMQAHNLHTLAACSSDYHLFRIQQSFQQLGLTPATVPAQPILWQCADLRYDFRELVGIVVYKFDPTFHQPKATPMPTSNDTAPSLNLSHPRVVVHKAANTLELFDGPTLIKTYPCITGTNPGDKATEGDRKTPLGNFRIVYKNPNSKFHLSLGLDYPNADDAARGLKQKLITQQQYNEILTALKSDLTLQENQQKLWYTPLGGEIFLHGHAEGRADTAGCVALSNPDIEQLYATLPINTPVEILP